MHVRHRQFNIVLTAVAGSLAGGLAASAQVPEGYEMVVIRTTEGIPSWPRINDQSQVIWSESKPPADSRVFLYEDGETVEVTDGTFYDLRPTLNSVGTLAWVRGEDWTPPFEIVVRNGETPVSIPGNPTAFSSLAVNDHGMVVWNQDVSPGGHPDGDPRRVEIFSYDGESVRQITDNELSNQGVNINNLGQLVWTRYDFNVNPWLGTIMLYSDGVIYELTDGTEQDQGVDINDLGQVIWSDGAQHVVTMWENGEFFELFENGRGPQINNSGDIVFARWDYVVERWDNWLYKDGEFYDLPDLGYSVPGGIINEHSEVVARVFDVEPGINAILMLRRCEPGTGVPCDEDIECADELCIAGDCDCGHCVSNPRLYGDVNQDGQIDMGDILCVLDGFGGEFGVCAFDRLDIGGCDSDGVIDLLDILGVLDAFAGKQACCP